MCRSACYVAALIVLVAHHRFGPGWVGVSSPARPKVRPEPQVVCAASLTWKWDDKLWEGTSRRLTWQGLKVKAIGTAIQLVRSLCWSSWRLLNTKTESVVKPQRGGEPLRVFFRVGKLVSSSTKQYQGKTLKVLEGENMLVELPLYGEFERFVQFQHWLVIWGWTLTQRIQSLDMGWKQWWAFGLRFARSQGLERRYHIEWQGFSLLCIYRSCSVE